MNNKAEFAVEIIKKYAKENQIPLRSTSDLSKFEEWLLIELFKSKFMTLEQFKSVFNWINKEMVATKLNEEELKSEFLLFKNKEL